METDTKALRRRCLSSLYLYVQVSLASYVCVYWHPCIYCDLVNNKLVSVSVTVVVLETLNSALQKQESLSSNDKVLLLRPIKEILNGKHK